MKKLALIVAVCVAGSSAWAATAWFLGTEDNDFNNPDNYGTINPPETAPFTPNATNSVNFSLSVTDQPTRRPIIFEESGSYEVFNMWSYCGESGTARDGYVDMQGGTLTMHGHLTIGYHTTDVDTHHVTNIWNMTGGVVTGGTYLSIGQNLVERENYDSSQAQLLMSGEDTAMYFSSWLYVGGTRDGTNAGNRAYVDISDGAVLQTSLNAVQNLTIRDGSQVNLSGGYISLFGNRTNAVMDNVEAGKITAFGFEYGSPQWDQGYQVLVTYDSGTDYTTVSAIPEPGTLTLLGLLGGGLLLFRKRRRL